MNHLNTCFRIFIYFSHWDFVGEEGVGGGAEYEKLYKKLFPWQMRFIA